MKGDFRRELAALINRYSYENASDTPDFILAEFMSGCLEHFERATRSREHWYGRPVPGNAAESEAEAT